MQTRTFLFADLRDYTKFVEHHGDATATTLIGDYRRLVRAEVERHEGAEIKTEGDSFYVVFTSAQSALRCGTAILREAERYSAERPDRPMKVGVGIHAGEPQPHEGQFVGEAVIVAARLAQQAGPGELLASEIVRGLLPRGAIPKMEEREGLTLKGIERAPRILSVAWRPVARSPHEEPGVVAIPAQPPEDGIVVARELVGRETELGALLAYLEEAARGQGRLVLVAGEAGLGKSALVRRFLDEARDRSIALTGECSEIEARRPFGPIVDAFEAVGLPLPPEFGAPGPGAMAQVESDRYRVHASFVRVLRERAATKPVVLVVEDVHWADEATLELLQYLPRQIRTAAVLVVATYRSDELHRRHPLNDTLAELERGRLSPEIRLRPLDDDGTARLIASALRLDRSPTTEFRRAIHERCAGNPFFTEEVLRALVQRGDIAYEEGSWRRTRAVAQIELPRTISAAVDQRLRHLSERSLGILRVAAVIGARFDFDILARVSGAGEDELVSALREAVDAQLVVEERQDHSETYRFRHALIREAVVSELIGRERRSLHRRVAEALESRAGGAAERHAEELAYHFDEADDVDKTIVYRRLAAAQASRAAAFRRAQEHLDRAVELAPSDRDDLPQLYLELCNAAGRAGDIRRKLAAAEAALALAEERGEPLLQAAALMEISAAANDLGEPARRDRSLDRALSLLEPAGPSPELARAYQRRAYFLVIAGDPTAADAADRAAAMARATGATEVLARALNYAGAARGLPEGVALLRESFRLAEEHDLLDAANTALNNLHVILQDGGRGFDEICEIRGERLEYARRTGMRTEDILDLEVVVALEEAEWDAALRVIDEVRGASLRAATRALGEALILVARAGPPAGLHLIAQPRDQLLGSGLPEWIGSAARAASIRYLAGDPRGAVEDARPLLGLTSFVTRATEAVIAAILAADEIGDASARDAHEKRVRGAPRSGNRIYLAAIALAEGVTAERTDPTSALEKYEEAAALAEEWREWIAATHIRLRRARLLAARGDLAAVRAEFDHFLPYWRKAKATWYLGELEKHAREIGIELVPA